MGTTPQVYIADLGAYVAGRLRGKWFTPTEYEDAEAFQAAVGTYIARRPGAEEWAIHDYGNWGGLASALGEYQSLEKIFELAQLIEEHGQAYIAYVSNVGAQYATPDGFSSAYRGEYADGGAFAEEWYGDVYSETMAAIPDELRNAIDWDDIWETFVNDGYTITPEGYVFSPE